MPSLALCTYVIVPTFFVEQWKNDVEENTTLTSLQDGKIVALEIMHNLRYL